MLSITDVLTLMAEGETLPQEKFPPLTDEQIEDVQNFEPVLLNRLLDAEGASKDPVDTVMDGLREKTAQHGWYPVVAVLCVTFSHRYREDMVPANLQLSDDTMGLLGMLPIAGRSMKEDEGAWTIPLAMLAGLGEEGAMEFTACAAMCAAVGFIETALEQEARA